MLARSIVHAEATDRSPPEPIARGYTGVRCWLDAVDAAMVSRSAELATAGGRRSSREADVIAERATVCTAMPEVHAALSAGTLSAGHADAIAGAANRLDDREQVELAAQAASLVEQAATTVSVDVFARQVRGARPAHLPRRRPAPSREAARAAHGATVDGPPRHVPHPDQPRPRPRSRRPPVSHLRRRHRRREGQARRRPRLRPAEGRRVHGDGDGDRDDHTGRSPPGRTARADRPRDAAQRPPRSQRVRDLRRTAPPTSSGPTPGVRSGHHRDRAGR